MVLEELLVELGLDFDKEAFLKAEEVLHGFHVGIAAVGAAAVGAAAVGIAYLTKEAAEYGEQFNKLAQQTGIGVESLQRLNFAAEMADVPLQTLKVGLSKLAKSGVKDLEGGLLDLADQFEKMPDGGEKLALAQKKFGKAGRDFIPWLNKGRKGMEEWLEKADEFGLVMSPEETQQAEDFNDQIKALNAAFRGLKLEIGKSFFKLLDTSGAIKGVVALRKAFKQWVADSGGIQKIVDKVIAVGKVIAAVVIGFKALALVTAAYGALSTGVATRAALAWLAAAAPVTLVAVLIGGLYLILQDFYYFMTGQESFIGTLFEDMPLARRSFNELFGYLTNFKAMLTDVRDLAWSVLKAVVAVTQGRFRDALNNMLEGADVVQKRQALMGMQALDPAQKQQLLSFPGLSLPPEVRTALQQKAQPNLFLSPQENAAAASSGGATTIVQAPVSMTVNAAEGMSAKDVADHVNVSIGNILIQAQGATKK